MAGRSAWSAVHADYVQITGDFPAEDDVYWRLGKGKTCAGLIKNAAADELGGDRDACETEFGTIENLVSLKASRELSIGEAFADRLSVRPRHCASDADCAAKLQKMACCFPAGTAYTVRASRQWLLSAGAGLHDIVASEPNADGARRCVHGAFCDPRKKYFRSRAFEVCDASRAVDSDGACSIDNPNVGCVSGTKVENGTLIADYPVEPRGVGRQCIFENITARFVVYRGKQPSTRDMSFSWQTTGGFVPLSMSLASQSFSVNPQSMAYLAEPGFLAVVDGATLGLSLFNLNSLGLVSPSPFY